MQEESRIIDFPEATAPAADDYLLMDSETNGTQKILVSKIGGGGSDCVNPNYEWWANEDKTIVIRRKLFDSNNNYYSISECPYRIYFNWFDINTASGPFQTLMNPPFIYAKVNGNARQMFAPTNSQVYADCDQSDYGGAADAHGYIGFYNGTIRGWAVGLGYNQVGKYRAIYESTYPSGAVDNPTPWEEPTFDPING
jgi:hypothetical protein